MLFLPFLLAGFDSASAFSLSRSHCTSAELFRASTPLQRFSSALYVATDREIPVEQVDDAEFGVASTPTKQFDWNKQWYPLAIDEFTDRSRAHALMFLGNNVVLWHDKTKWNVFEDACPHRGVPLSEGRVESNGELLCSYHAWTFNGEGECTSIPQTISKEKEASLLRKACAHVYPTQERQGLIWVWGSKGAPGSDVAIEAALKSPHLIDELEDPALKGKFIMQPWNFRDRTFGWDFLMENTFDPAHVPVAHSSKGSRYTGTKPLTMKRVPSSTEIPVHLGGRMLPGFEEDAGFKYEVQSVRDQKLLLNLTLEFRPPALLESHTSGGRIVNYNYNVPTRPGFCRVVATALHFRDENGKLAKFIKPLENMAPWKFHTVAGKFLVISSVAYD